MNNKKYLAAVLTFAIIISSIVCVPVSAAWVTGDNLAPQAKLSAWPTGGDTGNPSSVVDGVIGSGVGGVSARWYAYTGNIAEAYIEFEFPMAVTLGGAKIVSGQTNTSTSAPDILENFAIQYYDGKTWRDATEVIGNTLMTASVRFPKMVKATKFRLASRQSKAFRIRELELYEAIDTGNNMIRVPELDGTKYRLPYEALANLGVIDDLNGFDPETIVTKEEFIHYILKLSNNANCNVKGYKSSYTDVEKAKYRDEIVYAELLGYIGKDGENKFYPKKEITYTEAVQILLSMGGYDSFAEEKGGYPEGYKFYASKLGLDDGVEPLKNDYITIGEVVLLLYNATSMPVYENTGTGDGNSATDRTFLEYFRNIHHISGILYQTDTFGIPDTAPDGQVRIGDKYYNIGEADAKDYVGYHIEAWYAESREEKTLVYLTPSNKNRVYNLDKKFIGENSDFSTLHYFTENDKEKTLNVSYDSYVFLNKELGTAYTYDLYTGVGSLKLIDNDNDGSIDVIFIDSVRYMVVASVSNDVIYDKLGGKSIDTTNIEELIIMKDGFRCLVRDIKENDVLAVSEDMGGRNLTIYANDDVVTGTVMSIRKGENYVKIDDKEYQYIDEIKSDLEIGMTADFHLDHNGIIVYAGDRIKEGLQYGLMIGFAGDEWKVRTKLMDTNGKINEFDLSDKVLHNDLSVRAADLLKSEMLFDVQGKFYTQVVKYQIGKDGKLKRLYTAGISAPDSKSEPALLEEEQNSIVRYKDSAQYFYSKPVLTEFQLGRTMILSPETIIFTCPKDVISDEDYSVSTGINGLISGDWLGTVSTYDLSYNNVPGALLFKRDTNRMKIGAGTRVSVIIGKQEVYDEATGEVKLAFNMYTNGTEETVILSDRSKYDASTSTADFVSSFGGDYNETDLTTLDTGDVIQYGKENNEIRVIRILAKAKDLKKLKADNRGEKIQTTGGSSATYLPAIDTAFGSAYSGDMEVLTVEIEGVRYSYNCSDTACVYIFNTERNTVRKGILNDLVYRRNSAGESQIFVRANAKKIQDIMIVE